MKKGLLVLAVAASFWSCKNDDEETAVYQTAETIELQNQWDDQCIQAFLNDYYLDNLGNIKHFSSTDASDDNYPSLAALKPVRLNSGVYYLIRENKQPSPGTAIGGTDIIRMMGRSLTMIAASDGSKVNFQEPIYFMNTIDNSGVPLVDPAYYYAKPSLLASSGKDHSYFEIEGLREGLSYFKAFNKDDSEGYDLQGVIIIPSRAAFARDAHNPYAVDGLSRSWANRTFIFNFQIYKTTPRT